MYILSTQVRCHISIKGKPEHTKVWYVHSISLEWTNKCHENLETSDWDSVISLEPITIHYRAFIPTMLFTEVWVHHSL